jgi:dihydrofolate synthase/folylpolyglutamate synthase
METLQLSFFEMTIGLAFDYFASQQVDIAVVEVGMGGRLDSTNVITPLLSIITNIGFDHTQFLGDTLPKIAAEKAGIIKPGIPVVIGETHPETRPVFEQKAAEMRSPIYFADDHYRIIEQPAPPSLHSSDLQFTVEKLNVETGKWEVEKFPGEAAGVSSQFSTPNSQFSSLNSQF